MKRYSTLARRTTVCLGSANDIATAAISEVWKGYGRPEEPEGRGRVRRGKEERSDRSTRED